MATESSKEQFSIKVHCLLHSKTIDECIIGQRSDLQLMSAWKAMTGIES